MLEGEAQGGRKIRVGVLWLECKLLLSLGSLEYHSSMIADAVKKVIKVGKVSFERLLGHCAIAGT